MRTKSQNPTLIAVAAALILGASAVIAGPAGSAAGTAIPDGDPSGVTMGPLSVSAGAMAIQDIVVGLEITHTYAGDLSLTLHYDSDNDGTFDASSAIDLHLARMGNPAAEELYGIPIELGGTYFFKDEGWEAAGEDVSFATTFDGQPDGGSFYLTVVDGCEGNEGLVANWTVDVQAAADPRLEAVCAQRSNGCDRLCHLPH